MNGLSADQFTRLVELVNNNMATDDDINALEPYRVKRAIFIAAGFGSRMVPITLTMPKPLVKVNGVRIIDTLIDACLQAGIEEIIIVRGYLKDQFNQLLDKYPMITFIDNDMYTEANNISSAYLARHLLQNAYVFEADLLLDNPSIIRKYHYSSDFLAIPVDSTDDWCFETRDGIITKECVGGTNCHQMVGISYWDEAAGRRLEVDLEEHFSKEEGKQSYWEQVPLVYYSNNYQVSVLECAKEDIVEIDTFDELVAIDDSYRDMR